MADFNPALPTPGKWNIYENGPDDKYNPGGKKLQLKIPVESIPAFCQHLMNLADDPMKHKEIQVYDFEAREKKTVTAVVAGFGAKPGLEDDEGWFGSINPKAHKPATETPNAAPSQWNNAPLIPDTDDIPF